MARQTPASSEQDAAPKLTDYIVLMEQEVTVHPVESEDGARESIKVFIPFPIGAKPTVIPAADGNKAIEQYTGDVKAGKGKPGRYKAVAWSAWKGVSDVPEPVQTPIQNASFVTDE